MYAPPEAFIFERKNKPSVTSTAGPLKPRHYKIKVPKVQNMKPGAPPGLERVPRGKKKIKTESAARVPRPPWARRRALGPSGQSRRRREARRRARLPPEPGDSRPTLASALSPSLAPAAPRTRLLALQRGPNAPRGAEGDRQGLGQPGRYRRGGS